MTCGVQHRPDPALSKNTMISMRTLLFHLQVQQLDLLHLTIKTHFEPFSQHNYHNFWGSPCLMQRNCTQQSSHRPSPFALNVSFTFFGIHGENWKLHVKDWIRQGKEEPFTDSLTSPKELRLEKETQWILCYLTTVPLCESRCPQGDMPRIMPGNQTPSI